MSNKEQLSVQRQNTIINQISKKEDIICYNIVKKVIEQLKQEFCVNIVCEKKILLKDIIDELSNKYPQIEFDKPLGNTFMTPDGGITYLLDKSNKKYPILIAEVKNQGTNDKRVEQGLKKQSKGNAVERLGKNVIGFRTWMLAETIFPFVCFGDGCDFEPTSSILDRVKTIAMFGKLNTDYTTNEGKNNEFNRGSFYFREKFWTEEEMYEILYKVAKKSIYYYFSKYGDEKFKRITIVK